MPKVILTVTCDWDGLDYVLDHPLNAGGQLHFRFDHGLQALHYFNEVCQHRIPLTHFICPVYFTRSTALSQYYAAQIAPLLYNSRCEVGLHLHGWLSFVRACGVPAQDPAQDPAIPDWGDQPGNRYGLSVAYTNEDGTKTVDYGHGVPLSAYQEEEIATMLAQGRQMFVDHQIIKHIQDCVSFRSGGWMANDTVLTALQRGAPPFRYEASAVDASFFATRSSVLDRWLARLWGSEQQARDSFLSNSRFLEVYSEGLQVLAHENEVSAAQPQKIQKLVEIPDTAILADYVSADYMQDQIDRAVVNAREHSREVYVSIGFHLESGGDPRFGNAFGHIEKVIEVLQHCQQLYERRGEIEYLTIAEAGERLLQSSALTEQNIEAG